MTAITDSKAFRWVLGHYPTGVCVITAMPPDGTPAAMVVGSFMSVSLDPPLVAFFPDRSSTSWPKIEAARHFCVNVLGAHQQNLCEAFTAKTKDKLAGIAHRISDQGAPILDDIVAYIECSLHDVYEAGDHFIVLGRVCALDVEKPRSPLLFFRGGYGRFSHFE